MQLPRFIPSPFIRVLAACIGLASASAQCPPSLLNPDTIPSPVIVGLEYPTQVIAAPFARPPVTFSFTGALPEGLTFANGVISGTPRVPGRFEFVLSTRDADNCLALAMYSLEVVLPGFVRDDVTVTSGNGVVEPGEGNTLNVRILNRGLDSPARISATLVSDTFGVNVVSGTSAYPDIPSGGTGTNLTPFAIATDSTVRCFSQASFRLLVSTGNTVVSSIAFSLPVGQTGDNYTIVPNGTGSIPEGTLVPGSQDDDVLVPVTLPFELSVYGNVYPAGSVILAGANGNLQFDFPGSEAFNNRALPAKGPRNGNEFPATAPSIFPFWDDLLLTTDDGGIFTAVTGEAPQRVFTIRWRGSRFVDPTALVDFAVQFTEGSAAFDFVYQNSPVADGISSTIGLQAKSSGPLFTQYSFRRAGPFRDGFKLTVSRPTRVCSPGGDGH